MVSLQLTTALMGMGLAALILLLVRRDHLYLIHGLFWVLVAALAAVLGAWPGLVDRLASVAGISYPPALLLLLASVVLFIKALHSDMVNTRIERDVRRLNQRLALLEADGEGLLAQQQQQPLSAPSPAFPPDTQTPEVPASAPFAVDSNLSSGI